jgi:hypothetical protein
VTAGTDDFTFSDFFFDEVELVGTADKASDALDLVAAYMIEVHSHRWPFSSAVHARDVLGGINIALDLGPECSIPVLLPGPVGLVVPGAVFLESFVVDALILGAVLVFAF